jgi:hypothetical protein
MKIKIKLRHRHPKNRMPFFSKAGMFWISNESKELAVCEEDLTELSFEGNKHWFVYEIVEEKVQPVIKSYENKKKKIDVIS